MPNPSQRAPAICLAIAFVLTLAGCSNQPAAGGPSAITDAAPGTYEFARQCFRALGLQALTSGTGTPTGQDVMDRSKALAIAAGEKQGMHSTEVLTDLLRLTGEGASRYQSLSGSEQAAFASASQTFAGTCLEAQR